MTSPLDHVDQLCAFLAATDIGLLELKGPAGTLRLRHDGARVEVQMIEAATAAVATVPTQVIRAPVPGIYLDRHPLRSQPSAAVGAEVAAGTPLAFLQIGPLLLPVPAPEVGLVVEKFAEHGATVGYSAPLIGLQPHGSDAQ
ncbi:hypothetical protein [Bradyrhizobium sp. DOA9]|uniref:hypothetical protein n=1 Tax=Bradyrhizobium sp. DOA9 TaxID=1126627 RepID=UPI000468B4AD|nr:hypothetical protein [Bradyrhizobium sp. DOA9]